MLCFAAAWRSNFRREAYEVVAVGGSSGAIDGLTTAAGGGRLPHSLKLDKVLLV